jgi:hypothetical protein
MATPRDRRLRWPDYADQDRQRTEDSAEDHGVLAEQLLDLFRTIERESHDNPALVRELALIGQRDAALIRAAFADIQRWVANAKHGRKPPGE